MRKQKLREGQGLLSITQQISSQEKFCSLEPSFLALCFLQDLMKSVGGLLGHGGDLLVTQVSKLMVAAVMEWGGGGSGDKRSPVL